MTTNYKADAIFEVRKYLWDALVNLMVFDEEDYYADNLNQTIVPIIPIQQSPEMDQFLNGKKHIIYDKISMSYDTNWLICNEQFLFTIYATDYAEINEIRNVMVDLFRRMDESAHDVNMLESLSDLFKFHSIYIADISPTVPSDEIKGFLSADIVLDVKYSRITDSVGRFL
jgi:hypothetical protein